MRGPHQDQHGGPEPSHAHPKRPLSAVGEPIAAA
jgi:hypothetical protein